MYDFEKIYIYTTGKKTSKIIFRDLAVPMQIQHPLPPVPVTDVNINNVHTLFELTKFDTAENIMPDSIFQDCLKNDFIKAFNEFGIELDNWTSKLSPDGTQYTDGDAPVWSDSQKQFVPGAAGVSGSYNTTDFNTDFNNKQLTPINPVNSTVASGDTVLTSINKLQGQINAISNNKTKLKCIQLLPSNQVVRVDLTTLYFQFSGSVPFLDTSASNFNANVSIIVELNGIPLEKGTQVIRLSSNQLYFSEEINIDESIFIYS